MNETVAALIKLSSHDAEAKKRLLTMIGDGDVPQVDGDLVVAWLTEEGKRGDGECLYWLGVFYKCGKHVLADQERAFNFFLASGKAGDMDAFLKLAECYRHGRGTAQDCRAAVKWLERARDAGNDLWADEIDGFETDIDGELAWWTAVAERGYPKVRYHLGLYYQRRDQIEQAASWYRGAAELGHRDAQYALGELMVEDTGVPRDVREAVTWLEKASDQRLECAMLRLGELYADEESGVFDMAEAVRTWTRLADDGQDDYWCSRGEIELSWCYCLGQGVAPDEEKAAKHLVNGKNELARVLAAERGRDPWWKRKADAGDPDALYWLGQCYNLAGGHGNGFQKKSYDCLLRAAEQGHARSQYAVGHRLRLGCPGAGRNKEESVRWIRLAASQGLPEAVEELPKSDHEDRKR